MMNKNKKWFLAMSAAAMMTMGSIAMAATTQDQQAPNHGKQHVAADKGSFRGDMKGFKGDNTKLLAFLKIDADTFKADMKAGKTLLAIANEQGISEQALKEFIMGEMTERIAADIKAGRIQQDKADQMKANMEQRVADMMNGKGPMHEGKGRMGGPKMMDHSKLLAFLKLDDATFKADMKAGKTLLAIANEQGVSEQALKDFMVQEMTERIAAGVKAGRISQDKADQMKANMEQRVADMINGKGPMHEGKGRMGEHRMIDNNKLLALLNIDADTFKADMKAGKSLLAIATEQGVSEQALKDFMIGQMTERIDGDVKAGRLPQDRADQMKADMDQHISDMISGKGPMHEGKSPMHKG